MLSYCMEHKDQTATLKGSSGTLQFTIVVSGLHTLSLGTKAKEIRSKMSETATFRLKRAGFPL